MSDRSVWDLYWHCDRIASCFDGAGATNYAEAVADGWRVFFAALPDKAKIIDLCTGNGAIALIAAEVGRAQGKSFAITAVDQADIDPPAFVKRHGEEMRAITFLGRTAVEALPFADGSFDVAISQYGIEYSDTARSALEVARVLAPGGRARFVVHAAEGIVASNARSAIEDADFMLQGADLIGSARRCLDAVRKVESGDGSMAARQRANAAVASFKTALALADRHLPHATDKVMLGNSAGVLLDAFQARAKVGFDAALAKVDQVETEILAHRGRLQALVDAALDEDGAAALGARLCEAREVQAECERLENDEGLIGHVVTARFS
ncbi:MAG TPA: class I SAM-dependent methyltransferase [Sphingomicrobium sp.]|nr:class I SAM-dependent methyltransferase [Sphingomicrobium sp.]